MDNFSDWSGDWNEDDNFTNDTLTNASLSCIARTLQNAPVLPFSPALIITVKILRVVVYSLYTIFGGVLNGLFLYLVCKYKKLQTPSFAIALQVSVLDLLLSLVMLPSFVISSVTDRLLQVEALCAFFGFFLYCVIPLQVSLMFFLAVDQFLLVFIPFWYPTKETKFAVVFSLLSWIGILMISVQFLPGIKDCIGYFIISGMCIVTDDCGGACKMIGRVLSVIIGFMTIVPVFLYGSLYCKAKKIVKESAASGTGSYTNKQQRKANVTFFLLFLTLVIVILPGFILRRVSLPLSSASYVVNTLWRFIVSALVITDPIVLMRNGDVNEALKLLKEKVSSLRERGQTLPPEKTQSTSL